MKKLTIILLLVAIVSSSVAAFLLLVPLRTRTKRIKMPIQSIIRVTVTRQEYSYHRPWQKKSPSTHKAIGAIIEGSRVLITSEKLDGHRYIELEKIESGEKCTASVEVVDFEANLALLRPTKENFLEDMRPLKITTKPKIGDRLTVWQVLGDRSIRPIEGHVTSVELTKYPSEDRFLTYRLDSSMPQGAKHFTLPISKDEKLAGLLFRYNSKTQIMDIVSGPVIVHFLKDIKDGKYQGFPIAGFILSSMEDPQLRRYLKVPEEAEGVYVQGIVQGSAAEKAGIQVGDVLLEVAGHLIDKQGKYEDPQHGKMDLAHLIRCQFYAGKQINVKIFRKGSAKKIKLKLDHIRAEDYLVPPYYMNIAPRYYILGGLVLQELSLPYLKEYGNDWVVDAPIKLVYYKNYQNSLDKGNRKKIVFLSGVFPTPNTLGYEDISDIVITRINNQTIRELKDVPKSLESPVEGFHKIEFEEHPRVIYLDPQLLNEIDLQIQQRYNLPALKNLSKGKKEIPAKISLE